ncbi:MAG TPA: metallophosphoesterase [Terriglobia bacterium]|nr:metallophosphoesterase [Terriglobia bacterium]
MPTVKRNQSATERVSRTWFSKRLFGVAAALVFPAGFMAGWAFWWEPSSLRVVEECVAVPLNRTAPLRAAVITDLHTGSPFNGIPKLRMVVDRVNAANPDVVFILGDLVVHEVLGGSFVAPEPIAQELGRLHSRNGSFAVLGNHDVWLDADRVRQALQDAAITVLDDRAVKITDEAGSLWVAGVGDYWTEKHNLTAALGSVLDDAPVILLTHNPDIFPDVPSRVSLTLAGHTHGGQVRIPFFGSPVVPSRYGQRFAAGQIVEDSRHMYVATGVGTSIIPIRFGVPPSVPILILQNTCP